MTVFMEATSSLVFESFPLLDFWFCEFYFFFFFFLVWVILRILTLGGWSIHVEFYFSTLSFTMPRAPAIYCFFVSVLLIIDLFFCLV